MSKICFFFFLIVRAFSVVRVINCHYNCPEFVEYQYRTLSKFCLDEFELIVFNDASTDENKKAIEDKCREFDIRCIRFEPEWHPNHPLNDELKGVLLDPEITPCFGWDQATTLEEIAKCPSIRHCHVLQYAFENFVYDHDDIVVILDADAFLIKPLSFESYLEQYDLVAASRIFDLEAVLRKKNIHSIQDRMSLPSPIVMFFNPSYLPDIQRLTLNAAVLNRDERGPSLYDTGADAYNYLQKHPELKVKEFYGLDSGMFRCYFLSEELKRMGFSDLFTSFLYELKPENVQFFVGEHFMHFGSVSFEPPGFFGKTKKVLSFLERLCLDSNSSFEAAL